MIPQAFITEWSNTAPWQTSEQIEQDLVICRALVEIFSDEVLTQNLAFRGGTAIHKLFLQPQPRYSEDIDLVQIKTGPFGPVIDRLKDKLTFLGSPKRIQKEHNNTLVYRFDSEFPPVQKLKLKIETNCREHFTVLGFVSMDFAVRSRWFSGSCNVTTYKLEELAGTKLRALYQRRKGRDLFDLSRILNPGENLNIPDVLRCYYQYMTQMGCEIPSGKVFLNNLDLKMSDSEFLGDITGLIRQEEQYNHEDAFNLVKALLIEKME